MLDAPVSVCPDSSGGVNTEEIRDLRELQIVFPAGNVDYRQLVGRRVAVHGSLSEAQSGHHYTKVILSADKIAAAP